MLEHTLSLSMLCGRVPSVAPWTLLVVSAAREASEQRLQLLLREICVRNQQVERDFSWRSLQHLSVLMAIEAWLSKTVGAWLRASQQQQQQQHC